MGDAAAWTEIVVLLDAVLDGAWAELEKVHPNPDKFVLPFLRVALWGPSYGGHFQQTDHALLGLLPKSDEEVREIVRSTIAGAVAQ